MTKKKELREERFAHEYVIDLNGEQAAIRAGLAPKSARVEASKLLTKPNVQTLIAELTKAKAVDLGLTAEKVLRELMLMGFSNMQDYVAVQKDGFAYVDLSKLTREQAAAIQEITTDSYIAESEDEDGEEEGRIVTKVKFKLADKRGSLELLGKYLKLFLDRTEVTGPGGGPIPIQIVSSIPRPKRDRTVTQGS